MRDDGLSSEEGEGYFASVSDLMVGVLFVFLLMLTAFALNYHDDSARLDQLIAKAQQADRLLAQNEALKQRLSQAATALQRELQDRERVRAGLLERLARGLQSQGIQFVLDQQSGVLRLSDSVPFETGSSDLTEQTRGTLKALAAVLTSTLPCFANGGTRSDCTPNDQPILETVLVEGHTDRQAYPNMTLMQSQEENDRLSAACALAVFSDLRAEQPGLDQLRNPSGQPLLGISGYGERRPLPDALSLDENDLRRNRRIDLRFVLSARTSADLRRLLREISALQLGHQ